MRQQRWLQVAAVAIGLFVVNVVARLVIRLWFSGDDSAENAASLIMFGIIGVALAIVTFVRAQRERRSRWLPVIGFGAAGGLLLTVLVGPFVSGDTPFGGGAGNFFSQVWLYGGFAIVGTALGYWIATALGRDYRSKSLQAYARSRMVKPRKVVRR